MSGVDIYQKLKEDIITLKLKPGQMISENEIAGVYNVSRTPIKNAFLRLKGEKYIEIIPQKGSFVTLLDMKYIKDIIYMRSVLEMDMLSSIIENKLTDEVSTKLEDNLSLQKTLIESSCVNPFSYFEIDSAFHYCLFEAVGRGRMWDIIQDCQVYYSRFRILDTMITERFTGLYEEHRKIADALKNQDKQVLKEHIFNHLNGNIRILTPKIEGEFKDYFIQHL